MADIENTILLTSYITKYLYHVKILTGEYGIYIYIYNGFCKPLPNIF